MLNYFKTFVLMGALTALLMFVGGLFKFQMMFLIPFVVISNVVMFWYSDKLVLRMHGAREVSEADAPLFYKLTRSLVTKADMPMPKLYIVPLPVPNAFATGPTPSRAAVAVSPALMERLSQDELEGVIAHELAHVWHRDTLIATAAGCIAGILAWVAHMAQWAMIFGGGHRSDDRDGDGGGMGMLLVLLIGVIVAPMIQLAISRSREYGADAWAGRLTGRPLSLANALRRIHEAPKLPQGSMSPATASLFIANPFGSEGALVNLFSTHPSLGRRVARLEQQAQDA